jgi:hypothetical protein
MTPSKASSLSFRTAMLANTFRRVVKAATNKAIYPRYTRHLQKRIVPGCINLGKCHLFCVPKVLFTCEIPKLKCANMVSRDQFPHVALPLLGYRVFFASLEHSGEIEVYIKELFNSVLSTFVQILLYILLILYKTTHCNKNLFIFFKSLCRSSVFSSSFFYESILHIFQMIFRYMVYISIVSFCCSSHFQTMCSISLHSCAKVHPDILSPVSQLPGSQMRYEQ